MLTGVPGIIYQTYTRPFFGISINLNFKLIPSELENLLDLKLTKAYKRVHWETEIAMLWWGI